MIASTVEGRMRIRANRLRSQSFSRRVEREVEALSGVSSVRSNPDASSIVVHFDSAAVEAESLEEAIMEICSPKPKGNGKNGKELSKRLNQATKAGMATTLATSLAYGYMGKKKQHIRYGTAFLAFAGLHMLRYSRTLLR